MRTLPPPLPESLIDLSAADDHFHRLKACSVLTYGELTLQRLPWSGLQGRHQPGISELTLPAQDDPEGARWRIRGVGGPLVGAHERAIFRALEWTAIESSVARGIPFANPLEVHPRDLCERLCWSATQAQFEGILEGMRSLCRIDIERIVPGKPGMSRHFGLLQSVEEGKPGLTDRLAFPRLIVTFDRRFVESINAGRVRAINWGLWTALQDPVPQRMLEILDPEFFALEDRAPVTVDADTMARLIPLDPSLPWIRRETILKRANAVLVRSGYAESARLNTQPGSRVIEYRPGPAHAAMRERLASAPSATAFRNLLRDIRGGGSTELPRLQTAHG